MQVKVRKIFNDDVTNWDFKLILHWPNFPAKDFKGSGQDEFVCFA